MKIFFPVAAFYPSQIGGPCNTLYWHCCALKNNEINPSVITTTIGIKHKDIGNKWLDLNCGRAFYGSNGIKSLDILKKISKEISKTDVLHLNSLFSAFSIYSYFYCLLFKRNKKIIWSVRGELNENALMYSSWKKRPLLYIYKKLNKNIIYHSTSPQETENIKNLFINSKIVEIPNLIDPSQRLNVKNNRDLLYVGRIHPIKSLHKIIESLRLSQQFIASDSRFIIVGKHEERHNTYKESLISLIDRLNLNKKVVFLGHLEGEEKERIYAESYALILASESENFGNVVVEALNQGTPVIASLGTPWEILERYNAGFHVSNNPKELSKTIEKLLLMESVNYQRMRINSCKLVDENFRIDTQIHKWIEVYKNI